MSAMNLALQTRRAVITLSLMALAMVCVAAKTATRSDAALSADMPRVESMSTDTVAVSAGRMTIHIAAPVTVKSTARCEAKIVRI
jgi:hypothetical protein